MRKTKNRPLPLGTSVDIDIAEGLDIAQGVITAADYDDGWLYRIDVTAGSPCDAHRNDAGELWVCQHEVAPANTDRQNESVNSPVDDR